METVPALPTPDRTALAVVPDVFFSTKICEVARHVGVTVRLAPRVADVGAAYAACGAMAPGVALVDMASLGTAMEAAIHALRAIGGTSLRIVAFGSHVDTESFATALTAGADAAIPRSKFVGALPQLLRGDM